MQLAMSLRVIVGFNLKTKLIPEYSAFLLFLFPTVVYSDQLVKLKLSYCEGYKTWKHN